MPETPQQFVANLAGLRLASTFNPYSEKCPVHDLEKAATIRRNNLQRALRAALDAKVTSVWIARDLGYRGGRRTGLALTDEFHLDACAALLGASGLRRATKGPAMPERTASVIWKALVAIGRPVFLWNVFPLHPHEPGDGMSNRAHSRREADAGRAFLARLLAMLKPQTIVAIGRDAGNELRAMGLAAVTVRHPSYGGHREFLEGIADHYQLNIAAMTGQGISPSVSLAPSRCFGVRAPLPMAL
jgi:hypothetical protein